MTLSPSRTLIFLAILPAVCAWWYCATLEWRGERAVDSIATGQVSPTAFQPVPLAAEPARTAAQRLLAQRSPDHVLVDALLKHSITLRPLYAPYWLDRAEAAFQAGDPKDAEQYLHTATRLWSHRPVLLWKAAMLRTRVGDTQGALASLRQFLQADPNDYRRALAVAARLQPQPAQLLETVLPQHTSGRLSRDDIVWGILRLARTQHDPALGEAAWQQLSPAARRIDDTAAYYAEWMASLDKQPEALAAWRHYRQVPDPDPLENGDFEQTLQGGLGWRAWKHQDVEIQRDPHVAYNGRYSLQVRFSGDKNIGLAGIRQYLPVESATRYTLSFTWRGRDITTRSGPYVSVRSPKAGRIARTEGRWGSWDWEHQRLSFTAPDSEHFVEVLLRRDRTDALDNKIKGELWLDDFRLTADAGEGSSG